MEYEGKYYNGRVAQGMPAVIVLTQTGLRIQYSAGEENGTVFWELEGLQHSEFNDATTLLRYGKQPQQSIAVFEQGFRKALEETYKGAAFLQSSYTSFLRTGPVVLAVAGLSLLALAVVFFIWGVPFLADRAAAHFPKKFERTLGEQLHAQLLQHEEVDSARTVALNSYLANLQVSSDFPVSAVVVKSDQVNAYAVPGGFVVLHSGLLDKMKRHEELAGLLGHEIGHVQLRHSTRALARSLSYYMLLSVLFGDISGLAAVIVDNANALHNLEYSRSAEQDADKAGLALLKQNRLDARGMVWLLQRLEADVPAYMEFLSTHPRTPTRIAELQRQLAKTTYKPVPDQALEAAWAALKAEE
ncbi:M48 family metallopeptidase [Pontibacter liquoris]|uniref:M48 family metallopeptidase n=1 Tax=Pontibacter liquoris TaxID=2905677 RepID=UPI001FA6D8BE|nr:M48 family metallopeptidase [Pontibacter liquoris]